MGLLWIQPRSDFVDLGEAGNYTSKHSLMKLPSGRKFDAGRTDLIYSLAGDVIPFSDSQENLH